MCLIFIPAARDVTSHLDESGSTSMEGFNNIDHASMFSSLFGEYVTDTAHEVNV